MTETHKSVLTWEEMEGAACQGVRMRIKSMIDNRKQSHGADGLRSWQNHIEGMVGERAVYKYYGEVWTPRIDTFGVPDMWDDVQIRATGAPNGRLPVHKPPKDKSEWRYVLVTGVGPEFYLRGWLFGYEAQGREDRWYAMDRTVGKGREAFNMEQYELRPMSTLEIPDKQPYPKPPPAILGPKPLTKQGKPGL